MEVGVEDDRKDYEKNGEGGLNKPKAWRWLNAGGEGRISLDQAKVYNLKFSSLAPARLRDRIITMIAAARAMKHTIVDV